MDFEKTKAYIDGLVRERGIPYIDLCAWQDHAPIVRYVSSLDNTATGKECTFLYSATKPMTVVCGMRLIEEGKLSLDDPVSKYLPKYAHAYTLTPTGARRTLDRPMLVRHLFTMTAGLDYNVCTPSILAMPASAGTVEFVNAFVEEPLSFQSGERFQYSLCHDVLGAVIEVASGKRFSEYMRETLFTPLGMQNTDFHLDDTRTLAKQYTATPDGRVTEIPCENGLVLGKNYDSGGAGVCGGVDDYIVFADALACGGVSANGYRVLEERSVKKLRENEVGNIALQNTFTCIQGDEYGYGLGMRVRTKDTPWGLKKGEFGWDGAAGTYLMIDPNTRISVVIGMHVTNWPSVFNGEHLQIVKRLYQELAQNE